MNQKNVLSIKNYQVLTRKSEHQLKQKRALTENCEMWKLESIKC